VPVRKASRTRSQVETFTVGAFAGLDVVTLDVAVSCGIEVEGRLHAVRDAATMAAVSRDLTVMFTMLLPVGVPST
jgi:hypothetical protein